MEALSKEGLVLKIEYHRELVTALEEDATSKSNYILSPSDHKLVMEKMPAKNLKESLKKAAEFHRELFLDYKRQFAKRFPNDNPNHIFESNMDSMIDEIGSLSPLADPNFQTYKIKPGRIDPSAAKGDL